MRRARLIPLLLFVMTTERASAQWQLTGDAGAAHLRQPNIPESSASTFGASAEVLGDRAWFRSSVLAARTTMSRWTTQGVAVASFVNPLTAQTRLEFSGSVSGFAETNGSSTSSLELMPRLHLGTTTIGAALGLGVGGVASDVESGGLFHIQGDLWRAIGADRIIGTVSFVNTQQNIAAENPRVSYTDLSATWRRDQSALSFGATAGLRAGPNAGWGSADAVLWVLPHAAFVATVGRSLEDVTRGVPPTRYASLAIRLSARPQPSLRSGKKALLGPTLIATREFIEVRVPEAAKLEIMGDFTDWTPVALPRDGSVWRLARSISPGPHRLALRIDGGEWTTPVNLPRVNDELGGQLALLTVP